MRFEQTTLNAIRFRAEATGDSFMEIDQLAVDLGGPADFSDVLDKLHAKGLITLHRGSDALSLTDKGRRAS